MLDVFECSLFYEVSLERCRLCGFYRARDVQGEGG